jgi:hypothetical protein
MSFKVVEKCPSSPIAVQLLEYLLLHFHGQRQTEAEHVANHSEGQVALNDFGKYLGGRTVGFAPTRNHLEQGGTDFIIRVGSCGLFMEQFHLGTAIEPVAVDFLDNADAAQAAEVEVESAVR